MKKQKVIDKILKKKKILIIALIILLAVVILVVLSEINIVSLDEIFNKKETKNFVIRDECSIIVGKLIHTIGDEDTCRIKCLAECDVRKAEFVKSEFTEKTNQCNICNCYCF